MGLNWVEDVEIFYIGISSCIGLYKKHSLVKKHPSASKHHPESYAGVRIFV
jgi:hypothetical protein